MTSTSLRHTAETLGVLVGAACSPEPIAREKRYRETLASQFNAIVAENCMKFMYVHPERHRYDFSQGDQLVAFARKHRMRLRGHTLAWHNQVPAWLKEGKYSRSQALDILQEHIFTVVGHFRGQARAESPLTARGAQVPPAHRGPAVCCWDVVNEAISDEGGWRKKSFWYETVGPDFLDHVFRWAHEADPSAVLFYNDYGMEQPNKKADACFALLRRMLAKKLPVHGVGFQCHLGAENQLDRRACTANLKRFHKLGLDIHFTEMDMGIKKPITPALREVQAEEFANRIRIGRDGGVTAFMFWGFTDRYSWVPKFTKGEYDEALLFDRQYRPKPAFASVRHALRS